MRVLPARTAPPDEPIRRRHRPPSGFYASYRACLRWEFGFGCAFCLLHEADLSQHGVEGTGLTSIEHRIPRSHNPALADEYANCYYACRYCNTARAVAPNLDRQGHELLDPCATTWAAHFTVDDNRLRPLAGDDDAAYTAEVYDFADPRKIEMRAGRARVIEECLRVFREVPGRQDRLLRTAEKIPPVQRRPLLDAAEELQRMIQAAVKRLERFRVVPRGSAGRQFELSLWRCRCACHSRVPGEAGAADCRTVELKTEMGESRGASHPQPFSACHGPRARDL